MPVTAREIRLKSRPSGLPDAANFELVTRPLETPAAGQILVRNLWMSVDPYMRGRMIDRKSYIPPFQIGAALEGSAVGVVVQSGDAGFKEGDMVSHFAGWRDHALVAAAGATRIDDRKIPAQAYLGPLGIPGLTAYVGLMRIAELKAGETVFVSAAAGAVGSVAAQIAKIRGARVIGSVGSEEKAGWLRDAIGVDAVINYKTSGDLTKALAEAAPEGIDVYFDNVGGDHLDAALASAKGFARFVLCGMIAQYNAETPPPGPRNIFLAVSRSLKLQGFIIGSHFDLMPDFLGEMSQWIAADRVKWRETVVEGLENAPDAFLGLFRGENFGKMLVRLGAK
ncbi:NADP-dependent oxidoreductase [Phreatobacter stygius]|uniref:NADP-dependent oxidoreductase n=1 Tax=Phreatobacter stygius TaxID=1940610 RepID=A0A4D7B539_9HYPH|nr:NADP-dependent oxidoreductase [Phreatobacter stygius]QCI63342.1 NADP-dependent oxidoreductase [Phreatobacter stygius]